MAALGILCILILCTKIKTSRVGRFRSLYWNLKFRLLNYSCYITGFHAGFFAGGGEREKYWVPNFFAMLTFSSI